MLEDLATGGHNILLGAYAGKDLVTESYQLVIIPQGCQELRTTMTPSEFEVVSKVIRRALGERLYDDSRPLSRIVIGHNACQWSVVVGDTVQFQAFQKPPNLWWRFWQRLLLGWKWESKEESDKAGERYQGIYGAGRSITLEGEQHGGI